MRTYLKTYSNNNWLLGDSGYPNEPWLLTPYERVTELHQEIFNKLHIKTRNCVERSFGVLKSIFRCLLRQRTLHYTPVKAASITNACFVTYNYLQLQGMVIYFLDDVIENIEENLSTEHGK